MENLDTQNLTPRSHLVDLVDYYPPNHFPIAIDWMTHHGMDLDPNDLDEGVVALYDGVPTAMGFFRQIGRIPKVAMFDGLVSNPDQGSEARHEALKEVIEEVLRRAKLRGHSKMVAFCANLDAYRRAIGVGFEDTHQTMLIRAL